jgi:DNA (cytosine-5)-methyltransferase 1
MATTTGSIGDGICQPFLIAYYGTKNMSAAGEPLPTVTARDRFGLVEAEVTHYRLDIRFRMLQPRELARAQGFPDEYIFTGSREDVVKQIGNAVPPGTARALAMEVLR